MEWVQVLSLFLANAALVIWFRTESRNDWKHIDAKFDVLLKELRDEMKDFHGRLCAIEERGKK